jgi:hypothetical protein
VEPPVIDHFRADIESGNGVRVPDIDTEDHGAAFGG